MICKEQTPKNETKQESNIIEMKKEEQIVHSKGFERPTIKENLLPMQVNFAYEIAKRKAAQESMLQTKPIEDETDKQIN